MANSRHTTLPDGAQITRSLGVTDETDFVAELRSDGILQLREEPVGRRLGRGEKLPSLDIDLRLLWEQGKKAEAPDPSNWLDELIAAIPIADFNGSPDKVGYQVKVWVLNYLKRKNEKHSEG